MICDKCGKSNASGVSVCSYCGLEMPKSTECNGFADILTVKVAEPIVALASEEKGKASDADMKNLLNKTNEIFKNTKFSLAAICVCILISAISIFMAFSTNSKLNEYEKKLDTIIENTSSSEQDNEDKVNSGANTVESIEGKSAPEVFNEEVSSPDIKDKYQEMKKNVETKVKKKQQEREKAKKPSQTATQSDQAPAQSEQAPAQPEQAPSKSDQVTDSDETKSENTQG